MFNIVKKTVSLLGFPQLLSGGYSGSSESNLTSSANITALAGANLSGDTALNATLLIRVQGGAVLSSELTLAVSTTIVNAAASIIVGESNLVATTSVLFPAASVLDFQSNLGSTAVLVNLIESRPLSGQSELSATVFVPLKVLNLPIVEYVYTEDRLLKRYGIDSGQSLTITGTTGKIVEYQTIEEIEDADYYYGGGRRHVLTNTEVTAVQNAGFSNLITTENL
jgi:hypothetical protein